MEENKDLELQKDEEQKEDLTEKKYDDDDVDKIVAKKKAEWKKELDKAVADAKKKAGMTEKEKYDFELSELKEENDRLKAEALKVELGRTASNLLREQKVTPTQDMLDFVVGEDEDSTKANVDKFVAIINDAVKAAETERATGTTPKNYGGNGQELSEIQKRIQKYKK